MAITFGLREEHPIEREAIARTVSGLAHDVIDVVKTLATRRHPHIDITLDVITDLVRLEEIGPAWDRIVFASPRYRPQASFSYVASYLEHLRPRDVPWACVAARRGGELVGVVAFLIRPAPPRGIAGVELDAASIGADIVESPSDQTAVVPELLASLAQAAPRWVKLKLGELKATSPTVQRSGSDPGPCVLDRVGSASYVRLPVTNDEYLGRLSTSFRKNVQRQARKLFALPNARVDFDATPAPLDEFIAIEASGWKGTDGNAIARRDELGAYYHAVVRRLAAAGALRWTVIRGDNRVLAAGLGVRMGNRLALDKIAYDQAYKSVGPGNVLVAKVIEQAIADHLDEVDFLTDHPWNRNWQADTRATYDVTIYRHTVRALLPWYLPDVAARTLRGARS